MTSRSRVLYDGRCELCQRSMRALQRRDTRGRLELLDLHHVELPQLHPALEREACLREMHVLTSTGEVLRGFDAFRHIVRQLPASAWWAMALYLPPIPHIGRLIYRWVARRRYRLSQSCATGSCHHPWHSGQSDSRQS